MREWDNNAEGEWQMGRDRETQGEQEQQICSDRLLSRKLYNCLAWNLHRIRGNQFKPESVIFEKKQKGGRGVDCLSSKMSVLISAVKYKGLFPAF